MGQTIFELAAVTVDCPPFSNEALDIKSCPASGSGDVAKGDIVDSLELSDRVLAEGEITSEAFRCCAGGAGGAKDFPLPNTLPPPSFRPDIAGVFEVISSKPRRLEVFVPNWRLEARVFAYLSNRATEASYQCYRVGSSKFAPGSLLGKRHQQLHFLCNTQKWVNNSFLRSKVAVR
jgi:hypothetical protein